MAEQLVAVISCVPACFPPRTRLLFSHCSSPRPAVITYLSTRAPLNSCANVDKVERLPTPRHSIVYSLPLLPFNLVRAGHSTSSVSGRSQLSTSSIPCRSQHSSHPSSAGHSTQPPALDNDGYANGSGCFSPRSGEQWSTTSCRAPVADV